jgi:hypothetical protein
MEKTAGTIGYLIAKLFHFARSIKGDVKKKQFFPSGSK